jgi:hypothetical protein
MKLSNFVCISQDVILSIFNENKIQKLILSSNHTEGYYERLPSEKNKVKEHHLFLVVKNNVTCFQDRVFRTISQFEKQNNIEINAYPGRLPYQNKLYNAIRFRESELEYIEKIIPFWEENGIEFFDKKKKIKDYFAIIQFKKHIEAEELKTCIYKDTTAKHIYYVRITEDVDFEKFTQLLKFVRNNCDFKCFEGSLVYSISHNYRIENFAMLYSPKCEEERLEEFKENFEKALKQI